MAGWLIGNGLASWVTDASPDARRARMARRVGSASAANVASRRWEVFITTQLYNHLIMHQTAKAVNTRGSRGGCYCCYCCCCSASLAAAIAAASHSLGIPRVSASGGGGALDGDTCTETGTRRSV